VSSSVDAEFNSRKRIEGIEGLRAAAAVSILVYHVWLYATPGPVGIDLGVFTKAFANLRAGVTLFFVLSGFLLFRPYAAAALRGSRRPSTGSYFRNRALRILPAYWVILLAVALLFQHDLWNPPQKLIANLLFAQNYVPEYLLTGIVPAWSLAIEVVFYAVLPLLGAAAIFAAGKRIGRLTGALLPVVFMVVLGIVSKLLLYAFEGKVAAVWTLSFFTHADWFAVGMALAVLRVLWEDGAFDLPRGWQLISLGGAALFAVLGMKLYYSGTLSHLEYQSVMAIGCGLVLAAVAFATAGNPLVRFLSWKPVLVTGLASYSLFLWHDPILRAFRDAGLTVDGRSGFLVNLLVIGVVSGFASFLTYRFVEKRALAFKRTSSRGLERPSVAEEPVGSLEESDLKPAAVSTPATR
jgi:peptidoglycan/LPS O-acetylase OafA/YrhL